MYLLVIFFIVKGGKELNDIPTTPNTLILNKAKKISSVYVSDYVAIVIKLPAFIEAPASQNYTQICSAAPAAFSPSKSHLLTAFDQVEFGNFTKNSSCEKS